MSLNIPMMGYFTDEMVAATWKKSGSGTVVNGEWTPGATTSTSVNIVTPSPVDANDVEFLDEGEHVKDYWYTWTARTDIFTRELNKDSDFIVWNGRTFKVVQVDDRKLGVFVRVLMKRVTP